MVRLTRQELLRYFYEERNSLLILVREWEQAIADEEKKFILFRDRDKIKFGNKVIAESNNKVRGMFMLVNSILKDVEWELPKRKNKNG